MTEDEALSYLSSKGIELYLFGGDYCFEGTVVLISDNNPDMYLNVCMDSRRFKTSASCPTSIETVTESDLDKFVRDIDKWRTLEDQRIREDRLIQVRKYFWQKKEKLNRAKETARHRSEKLK